MACPLDAQIDGQLSEAVTICEDRGWILQEGGTKVLYESKSPLSVSRQRVTRFAMNTETIVLSGAKMSNIVPGFFHNLNELQYVDISHNRYTP